MNYHASFFPLCWSPWKHEALPVVRRLDRNENKRVNGDRTSLKKRHNVSFSFLLSVFLVCTSMCENTLRSSLQRGV